MVLGPLRHVSVLDMIYLYHNLVHSYYNTTNYYVWYLFKQQSTTNAEPWICCKVCFMILLIHLNHDDVIELKHFPRYWPFVRGINRSPVNSPHKGQWRWAFMFSLKCVWINGIINNGEAGDLRRYRAHYDVTVMIIWTAGYGRTLRRPSHHMFVRPSSVPPMLPLFPKY